MKLKMLKTCLGSPDGRRVVEYLKGETHDLPADLAEAFVSQGWARAPGSRTPRRTKNAGSAPENKTQSSRKPSGGRSHGH